MTQTHEALRLAFAVKDRSRFAHETEHQAKLRHIKASDDASILLEQQHALIVQMAEALNGAESSLDDYNHGAPWGQYDLENFRRVEAANHTATQYLKAKP